MTLDEWATILDQQASRAASPDLQALLAGDVLYIVNEGIAANFRSGVDPDGNPWPPRVDAYKHPLLIKTGELLGDAGGKAGYYIAEPNLLVKGTDVDHAAFQNEGTERIPAREFMGLQKEYEDKLVEKVADGLLDMIFQEALS